MKINYKTQALKQGNFVHVFSEDVGLFMQNFSVCVVLVQLLLTNVINKCHWLLIQR